MECTATAPRGMALPGACWNPAELGAPPHHASGRSLAFPLTSCVNLRARCPLPNKMYLPLKVFFEDLMR